MNDLRENSPKSIAGVPFAIVLITKWNSYDYQNQECNNHIQFNITQTRFIVIHVEDLDKHCTLELTATLHLSVWYNTGLTYPPVCLSVYFEYINLLTSWLSVWQSVYLYACMSDYRPDFLFVWRSDLPALLNVYPVGWNSNLMYESSTLWYVYCMFLDNQSCNYLTILTKGKGGQVCQRSPAWSFWVNELVVQFTAQGDASRPQVSQDLHRYCSLHGSWWKKHGIGAIQIRTWCLSIPISTFYHCAIRHT